MTDLLKAVLAAGNGQLTAEVAADHAAELKAAIDAARAVSLTEDAEAAPAQPAT
ncbi:hypothetical protein [Streptomyces sp. NPDC059909]|uniref:hypothetical protein n=1 Tax=Streptomyces sp. NPDC059909 TaxID=3346998 RepID=UPI00365332A9